MKNYMIAPFHDVDSIVAHAIAEMWDPQIEHRQLEYNVEYDSVKKIEQMPNQIVLMADLGYSHSESLEMMVRKLESMKSNGSIIYFFDQHRWPSDILRKVFSYNFHSDTQSSSQLLANHLLEHNKVALYLASLATKDDFNIEDNATQKLEDLVNSRIPKKQLIHDLASLNEPKLLLTQDAQQALYLFRIEKQEAYQVLQSSYEFHETKLGKVVTSLSPQLLYMKPGHRKTRDDNPEMIMICFYDGYQNCTFRTIDRNQKEFLLSEFKGGGRGTEGGFDPGEIVTPNNYKEIRRKILNKLM